MQCWAIIRPPAMAIRWRAADGPLLMVFGSSLPYYLKTKKKHCQSWTPSGKLSESAHVMTSLIENIKIDYNKTIAVGTQKN